MLESRSVTSLMPSALMAPPFDDTASQFEIVVDSRSRDPPPEAMMEPPPQPPPQLGGTTGTSLMLVAPLAASCEQGLIHPVKGQSEPGVVMSTLPFTRERCRNTSEQPFLMLKWRDSRPASMMAPAQGPARQKRRAWLPLAPGGDGTCIAGPSHLDGDGGVARDLLAAEVEARLVQLNQSVLTGRDGCINDGP